MKFYSLFERLITLDGSHPVMENNGAYHTRFLEFNLYSLVMMLSRRVLTGVVFACMGTPN